MVPFTRHELTTRSNAPCPVRAVNTADGTLIFLQNGGLVYPLKRQAENPTILDYRERGSGHRTTPATGADLAQRQNVVRAAEVVRPGGGITVKTVHYEKVHGPSAGRHGAWMGCRFSGDQRPERQKVQSTISEIRSFFSCTVRYQAAVSMMRSRAATVRPVEGSVLVVPPSARARQRRRFIGVWNNCLAFDSHTGTQ